MRRAVRCAASHLAGLLGAHVQSHLLMPTASAVTCNAGDESLDFDEFCQAVGNRVEVNGLDVASLSVAFAGKLKQRSNKSLQSLAQTQTASSSASE